MIISFLLNTIVLVLGAIFSLFAVVTTLPTVAGFNIDAALVTGMAELNTFFVAFWPIWIMFQGFLAILLYFSLKLILRFFLGHRAPSGN